MTWRAEMSSLRSFVQECLQNGLLQARIHSKQADAHSDIHNCGDRRHKRCQRDAPTRLPNSSVAAALTLALAADRQEALP